MTAEEPAEKGNGNGKCQEEADMKGLWVGKRPSAIGYSFRLKLRVTQPKDLDRRVSRLGNA